MKTHTRFVLAICLSAHLSIAEETPPSPVDLGFTVQDKTDANERLGPAGTSLNMRACVVVKSVDPHGPAAGLLRVDTAITSVGGVTTPDVKSFQAAAATLKPGKQVEIKGLYQVAGADGRTQWKTGSITLTPAGKNHDTASSGPAGADGGSSTVRHPPQDRKATVSPSEAQVTPKVQESAAIREPFGARRQGPAVGGGPGSRVVYTAEAPPRILTAEDGPLYSFQEKYELSGNQSLSKRPVRVFLSSKPQLHVSQLVLTSEQVLKSQGNIFQDCAFLKQLNCERAGYTHWDSNEWYTRLGDALRPCDRVEVLDLPTLTLDHEDITRIAKQFPKLTALRCYIDQGQSQTVQLGKICDSLSELAELKALAIRLRWGYEKCDMPKILSRCKKLEYLEVVGVPLQDVLAVAKNCESIKTVVLPSFSWGGLFAVQNGLYQEVPMPWLGTSAKENAERQDELVNGLKQLPHVRTVVFSTSRLGRVVLKNAATAEEFVARVQKDLPAVVCVLEQGDQEDAHKDGRAHSSAWRTHVPEIYPGQQELELVKLVRKPSGRNRSEAQR